MAFWKHLHGASTHFPIVLIMIAVAFDVGAILFKKEGWRTVAFWCFLLGALFTIPSVLSGQAGVVGWFGVKEDDRAYIEAGSKAEHVVNLHRLLAFVFGGVSLVLALWRVGVRDKLRGLPFWLWLVVAVAVAGGIGYVGFLGGSISHGDYGPEDPVAATPAPEESPAASPRP
ncbi:MAG: DUF2231 domain-containing protein [Armatimonas sp.]